jgi:CoA:oxalate CoA-transferase
MNNGPKGGPAPLRGVRVIECGLMMQAPLAGAALADLGADVIRIESAAAPDALRSNARFWGVDMDYGSPGREINISFEALNRGKRSVALDLKRPEGRELLHRLVAEADVFLHNWSPRVARDLGIDHDALRTVNARLVYVASSGLGSDGPDADVPVTDPIGAGIAGLDFLASPDAAEPMYPIGALGDAVAALMGVVATLAGLLECERSGGRGTALEISQFGSLLWLESLPAVAAALTGQVMSRPPRAREPNPLFNMYCCGDGDWITLGEWRADRRLEQFLAAIERADLREDPRFADAAAIQRDSEAVIAILDEVFRTRPAAEWIRRLRAAGVAVAPVQTVAEAVREPQATANGYVQSYEHPRVGQVPAVALPIKIAGTPLSVPGPAPDWGQHTAEVLAAAGVEQEDLRRLAADRMITVAPD